MTGDDRGAWSLSPITSGAGNFVGKLLEYTYTRELIADCRVRAMIIRPTRFSSTMPNGSSDSIRDTKRREELVRRHLSAESAHLDG